MRVLLFCTLVLLLPLGVLAQPIDSYELNIYKNVTANPEVVYPFTAASVVCGITAPASPLVTVNPTKAFWNDPNAPGLVCEHVFGAISPTAALIVPGQYEATLISITEGVRSLESAPRSPFSLEDPPVDPPSAPTGLQLVQ